MKKILLPTDFSQKADNAAQYAIQLFREESARFLLLNAYGLPQRPTEVSISALQGGIGAAEKKALIENQHRYSKAIRQYGSSVKTTAEFGKTSRVIIDHAKKQQVDYLVMGTDGGNYYKKLFSGSPTREVFHKASCPIMAIPEETQYKKPKKIVFLPDLNSPVTEETLSPLLEISRKFKSEIVVLNFLNTFNADAAEQHLAVLKKILGTSFSFCHFLSEQHTEKGLNNFLAEQAADLFVLQGRRSFLSKLFRSWLSRRSRAFSALPILAIKNLSDN